MNIEIISIGRELLDGRTIDTNSVFFGEELKKRGLVPRFYQRVDDVREDMLAAFDIAAKRSDLIFVTGGLGPTSDDLTTEIFAKFMSLKLVENPEARKTLENRFQSLGRTMHDSQLKQAQFPQGAKHLTNDIGTAPGFSYQDKHRKWFFMPGVPSEMKFIFKNHIQNEVPPQKNFKRKVWMTHFTSEGELQQKLKDVIAALPKEISFFYRTRFPENHLGLSGVVDTEDLQKYFETASKQIEEILADTFFSTTEGQGLEAIVTELARKSGIHAASVESCTGGLVSSRITDVSGSSDVWWGAYCTYDNSAKLDLAAAVDLETQMNEALSDNGAVSEEVASTMALCGAKKTSKSIGTNSLCVSTTGVAGPSGGTKDKPVGMCCIAVANESRVLFKTTVYARPGLSRQQNKLYFSQHALNSLRLELLKQ